MKTKIALGIFALAGLSLASCDDFLDNNRYPLTSEVSNPEFWSNESLVEQECNYMYNFFSGYGRGNSLGEFYFSTLSDDQAGNSFTEWNNKTVPSSSGLYSGTYENIRHCMSIIEGVRGSKLEAAKRNNFEGQARLNRAIQFFTLVKRYGDVTWVDHKVDVNDKGLLYGPRTNRDVVMDSVLRDLDYAIATISANNGKQVWSKDLALAVKSDICLWEGTFCKYRTAAENGYAADEARANKYLQECVSASEQLIGKYPIGASYKALYQSVRADAQKNGEIIFMKAYDQQNMCHSTVSYTCSSTKVNGITKDAFDAYLFKDGKPLALTSENKSDLPVYNDKGEYSIADLLAVRDGRLSETIDPVIFYQDMTWQRAGAMAMTSSTGYGVAKFDNTSLPIDDRQNTVKNYTCAPLYWGALICLNYAEAKAELGTLTDADMNLTLNKLYERAGLPDQTVASLTEMKDPANNMGVSSLIWEVRRCRRCELIMDKDYRYWDLVRWHKLDLLDSSVHPNILLGANASTATVKPDMKGDYVDGSFNHVRTFEARQYLYPIPGDQIALTNSAVSQNTPWK